MSYLKKSLFTLLIILIGCSVMNAQYQEPMTHHLALKNMKDYGLINDNAENNQSNIVQNAINDLHSKGGGQLIIPKGTYQFSNIYLKSNIHLLIDKGTVIKPYWPKGTKIAVFIIDTETPKNKKKPNYDEKSFIRNVSIKGKGGKWIIDYSDRIPKKGEGARGILCRMVKNFCISDMDIKDNFSTYCGITLTPTRSKTKNISNWKVSRAADGLIRNCRIFNASPGYGLVQLHGAQTVHFEDLYANGGVTLRLETGAVGEHTAVFDITAKNIVSENGRCALMLGPHSAHNGVVKVDGIKSIGSTYAVQMGMGGVKKKELQRNPDAKPGSFADGTSVKNIHAIFGTQAQIKKHALLEIPEEYLDSLKLWNDDKFMDGPSIAPVKDHRKGGYNVIIENITSEGFKYNSETKILTSEKIRPGSWAKAFSKWLKKNEGKDYRVDKGPYVN